MAGASRRQRQVRIGVDIGGTFTDLILVDDATGDVDGRQDADHAGRSVATRSRPGSARRSRRRARRRRACGHVIHGTTLVTNAIIERKGAPTALLTTEGFRDALEIGREHRYDMYDLYLEMPQPLVPRYLRLRGRRARAGRRHGAAARCDVREVERLVARAGAQGIEAVAVVASAQLSPTRTHERQVGDDPRARSRPACASRSRPTSCRRSASTSAPRPPSPTSTCRSLVERYLRELERTAARRSAFAGSCSSCSRRAASRRSRRPRASRCGCSSPGPAAGALAAAHLRRGSAGHGDLLSFDMGGTTAKVCVIEDGEPLRTAQLRGRPRLPLQEGQRACRSRCR